MRFLSIEQLAARAREAAGRFPLALLSAFVAAAAGIGITARGDDAPAMRILLPALLGLPLFTALVTSGERARWNLRLRVLLHVTAIAALLGLWYALGQWTDTMKATRVVHLGIIAHLTVAVLPFLGTALPGAFWQYNRILFLRYLIGALFAAVLFAGLALALAAIDQLFGVDVDEQWYVRLWIVITFVFHPWFFLAGVPSDLVALEERDDYPAGLKVFAQFILVPVVSVYILILTAYLVRVVGTRTWPSGWIGYLVSSVAATGTLALLLVHPIRQRADSRWVDAYARWFFIALLPSIGMLLMAVWLRIDQYGITERRYFLAVLAVWLGGVAIYYAVTGSRNIRVIPATLLAVGVATFIGPWSAYAVSRDNQARRLRAMLASQQLLVDGRLQQPARAVPFEARREISGVLQYLIDVHGPRALSRISDEMGRFATQPPPNERAPDVTRAVMERMGLRYVSPWQQRPSGLITYYSEIGQHAIRLEGYEWMTRGNLATSFSITLGDDTISFAPDSMPARVVATRRGERLEISLWPALRQATDAARIADSVGVSRPAPGSPSIPTAVRAPSGPPPLMVEAEGSGMRIRFVINQLHGLGDSATSRVRSADAAIFIRLNAR
jgi:hypothetical protein